MTLKASDFTHVDLAELTAIHVVGAGGAGMTQCGMIDMVVGINAIPSMKKIKKELK